MKNFMSYMALMLCVIAMNFNAAMATVNTSNGTHNQECSCCKDCKSDKCKELCTKWDKMTSEEKKSKEGIAVKEDCAKICTTEKCCTSSSSCDKKVKKGCCAKK